MDWYKRLQRLAIALLPALLLGCGQSAEPTTDLPWQITVTQAGNPQVFHVEVGKSTLQDLSQHLRDFPEIALFVHENGARRLEAYFGKQRLGVFEAKLVAELQADDATLEAFRQRAGKPSGMASGYWKYPLAEQDIRAAVNLPLTRLVYLPAVDYSADILVARFGEPAQRLPLQREGVDLWLYPAKGLLIMLDERGGEAFHYTTPALYPVVQQELQEARPNHAK